MKGGGSASLEREHLGARLQALSSLLRDLGLLASGAETRASSRTSIGGRPLMRSRARLGPERVETIVYGGDAGV